MTIQQFMWGFQPHFRLSLESSVKAALGSIGAVVAPTALLVGFEEEPGGYPICVEPEGIGIGPAIFAGCEATGDAAYEAHENRDVLNTHPGLNERFHAGLRDRCRADALADLMDARAAIQTRKWFVGRSARVGRYRVYPVISVLRDRWEELPALSVRDHDHRSEMYLSLQEAVLREVLHAATFALSISEEPEGLRRSDREEIVRRAAKSFVQELVFFKGDFMGGDLDTAMNLVAAQPYEGRTGVGTLLMAKETDYVKDLSFDRPISLSQTRALRKALEMTGTNLHLITNGNVTSGLGALGDGYDVRAESAFMLRVVGRGSWELEHAGVPLVSFTDGHPALPKERIARDVFDDTVTRLFGGGGDGPRLWSLAVAAARQAHGTMVVVHANADSEAVHLAPPAMVVKPDFLTDETLLAVSSIDGAIVIDPAGRCHAVGAILDGRADPTLGDASRGARFNSAHRYLAEARTPCLIIIVSEDRIINLIPDLPRRVERSYVEDVVAEVEALSFENPINFETFHRRADHLRALAFYLSAQQCERANQSRERVENFRESSFESRGGLGGFTRVGYTPFEPNPRLDETFLPE